MFIVIFRARLKQSDPEFLILAQEMRELAFERYNCLDFTSVCEGQEEIALSYWHTEEDIVRWKEDVKHRVAQRYGQEKWYQSYTVEVAEVQRRYHFEENNKTS